MPIPCPCCKAVNETGPQCRRCKADLSLLFSVEAERGAWLREARMLTARQQFDDALDALDRAYQLRPGLDLSQARATVHLLTRNFPAAYAAYREITAEAASL